MLQNIDPDLFKLIVVGVIVILAIALAAPLLVLIQFARTRREDLERTFQAADPKTQQILLGVVGRFESLLGVIQNLVSLGKDVTDNNPNTPQYPVYTGETVVDALYGMQVLATFPHREMSADEIKLMKKYNELIAQNILAMEATSKTNAPSG